MTLLLALLVRLFVISSLQVVNDHMAPSLMPGDFILAYRLPYGIRIPLIGTKIGRGAPHRGDVVLFPCPKAGGPSCVSRIVGMPGDRIEIQGERLILNGEQADYGSPRKHRAGLLLTEKISGYEHEIAISGAKSRANFGPVIVGPGSVFMLSDHRDFSEDSRSYGSVPVSRIEARVTFVWISWDWLNESNSIIPDLRWSRVFKQIH